MYIGIIPQTMDLNEQRKKLLAEFKKQVVHPTANDPFIKLFFNSIIEISKNQTEFVDLIIKAQEERKKIGSELTLVHAVHLTLHALNYIMIFKLRIPDYPYQPSLNLLSKKGWIKLINHILKDYKPLYLKLLINNNIQETWFQRGVGFPFVIDRVFGDKYIRVADLGCSANLVWSYLITGGVFLPIIDHTRGQDLGYINQCRNDKINVTEQIGIDQHNPLLDKDSLEWLLACRHPKEIQLDLIEQTKVLLKSYKNIPLTKIITADISNPPLKNGKFDVITINNTLYQSSTKKRIKIINKAYTLLNPVKGMLIVQDHCYVSIKSDLVFSDSRKSYSYRLNVSGPAIKKLGKKGWLEIIRYKNTRCREAIAGKDLDFFMERTKS